jgi:hypothetical protein
MNPVTDEIKGNIKRMFPFYYQLLTTDYLLPTTSDYLLPTTYFLLPVFVLKDELRRFA